MSPHVRSPRQSQPQASKSLPQKPHGLDRVCETTRTSVAAGTHEKKKTHHKELAYRELQSPSIRQDAQKEAIRANCCGMVVRAHAESHCTPSERGSSMRKTDVSRALQQVRRNTEAYAQPRLPGPSLSLNLGAVLDAKCVGTACIGKGTARQGMHATGGISLFLDHKSKAGSKLSTS